MVVWVIFILPYWSTKVLPSHGGEIQRHFKKTNRKILTFILLQKYLITLAALRWANTTSLRVIFRKGKGIILKSIAKSSLEVLFSFLFLIQFQQIDVNAVILCISSSEVF